MNNVTETQFRIIQQITEKPWRTKSVRRIKMTQGLLDNEYEKHIYIREFRLNSEQN